MKRYTKTKWGVLGVVLLFLGIASSIPISIKLKQIEFAYGISIAGVMVILGLILIVWAFSD